MSAVEYNDYACDRSGWFFGLTGSQWTSIVVVVLCAVTLVRFARRPEEPGREGPAEDREPAPSTEQL